MKREFQVGDVCFIREWEDMEAEFGVSERGNIKTDVAFMDSMKYLCGSLFTVSRVEKHIGYTQYRSCEKVEEYNRYRGLSYIITGDMLELFEAPAEPEQIQAPGDFCSLFN